VRRGLHHSAAEEVDVGIEEVRGDGQQPSQRDRLLPEDGQRHRVTVFGVAADQLGGLADRHAAELVALVLGQPVRQQVVLDAGQRGHALRVAELAAVAHGRRLALVEQPLQRDRDVAEFSGHPGGALDHLPGLDDAAAESGADDHGHRAVPRGLFAEPCVMRVERGRVPVVVVDDGKPEALLQRAPDVETAPAGVPEVGRALGRDDTIGAGRTRRVQADGPHRRQRHAGKPEYLLHGVGQALQRLVRTLPDVAGHLCHLAEEESAAGVQRRPAVRGPAVIKSEDNPVDWHAPSSSGR
jgi:hypothetical protein